MEALALAQHYFDLSNRRDLSSIKDLLTESTTYSSQNMGVYIGVKQIISMKEAFYGSFKEMNWEIHSVQEVRLGVVEFNFTFSGITHEGEEIVRPGTEYVIVYNGKLQHIEVRNK